MLFWRIEKSLKNCPKNSLPGPTSYLFCFTDCSKIRRFALATKRKILSWKFVCSLLVSIATNSYIAILVNLFTKNFLKILLELSCPSLRNPWIMQSTNMSFTGIIIYQDKIRIDSLIILSYQFFVTEFKLSKMMPTLIYDVIDFLFHRHARQFSWKLFLW